MKLKFTIAVALALLATPTAAQSPPNIAAQHVWGRIGVPGDTGPSQAIPFSSLASILASSWAVASIVNSDGTLTISPTIGAVVASLALGHANTWTAAQTFNSGDFRLAGSGSGTLTQRCAAACGSNTLTWPAGTTDFSATGGASQFVKQTSAGGALTVAAITGADLPLTSATLNTGVQSNPTGTTSASGVMMGLGSVSKLTPTYSGRIKAEFTASVSTGASAGSGSINIRFGTGTAPTNGAAPSGTILSSINASIAANTNIPFTLSGIATGLTPGTAYWFDTGLNENGGSVTITITSVSFGAMEF